MTTTSPIPVHCAPRAFEQLMGEVLPHTARRVVDGAWVPYDRPGHVMRVLRDDGLYKHLRFRAADGSSAYAFDLVTWPGYLTIVGDIGEGFTFHRVPNMLAFFDHGQPDGHVNLPYWSEKLTSASQGRVRVWSQERFSSYVRGQVEQVIGYGRTREEPDVLRERLQTEVLAYAEDQTEALQAWRDFTYTDAGGCDLPVEDEWDPSGWTDWDHHFALACHAILWGARTYHASHPRQGTGE